MLLALLLGCAGGGDSADPCPRDPPLTWESWGEATMVRHCTGCHSSLLPESMREGAPVGVDLDTYAGVLQWHDRIRARSTGEAPTMPPGGGPSAEEVAMLTEWLDCAVAADVAALEAR